MPVFGKEPEEVRPDKAEELAVFEEEEGRGAGRVRENGGEIISRDAGGDVSDEASRLGVLRQELVQAGSKQKREFKPLVPERSVFRSAVETLGTKPSGRLRKFMHFALTSLGLLASDKLQAADSMGVSPKPDAVAAGVPVFRAPTQLNTNTNIYNYQGETWQPKTPEEKEKMQKARAALEAQKASAPAEKSPGVATYGQYQQRNESQASNAGVRPEARSNQVINTGHYPNASEGRFINQVHSSRPNDAVFIQGQGGIYYPEPSYPQHNYNYGMRGRYSSMPMPSTVYYGVPPGGQIPDEERELFGKRYRAITRDAALGISNSENRGEGNYQGRYDSTPRPQKPKSR